MIRWYVRMIRWYVKDDKVVYSVYSQYIREKQHVKFSRML